MKQHVRLSNQIQGWLQVKPDTGMAAEILS